MKTHAFRLTYGTDLRKGIEDYCAERSVKAAAVIACVGCVYRAVMRLADGKTVREYDGHYEIVSLTGTLSANGAHMHISLADEEGMVIGGHLAYGSLINTTAEVVLAALDDEYEFSREYDETTGYDELVVSRHVKC